MGVLDRMPDPHIEQSRQTGKQIGWNAVGAADHQEDSFVRGQAQCFNDLVSLGLCGREDQRSFRIIRKSDFFYFDGSWGGHDII